MAKDPIAPVIIIKKIKKGGHGGHHGGAWKVAYADFVTAMMAFFLLMWLLNATSEQQRRGIANYFDPIGMTASSGGSNGAMGGTSVKAPGSFSDSQQGSKPVVPKKNKSTEGDDDAASDPDSKASSNDADSATSENRMDLPTVDQAGQEEIGDKQAKEDAVDKELEKRENEAFEKAEKELRQAIDDVPELKSLSSSLIIDRTPEGLRIQIVDQDKLSMFPNGSAKMYDHTRKLLDVVAKVILKLPNKISVTGHTDSLQYPTENGYTNWELSADRANASRKVFLDDGIGSERIASVVGKADRDPLIKDNAASPRNRRISIVLLHAKKIGYKAS